MIPLRGTQLAMRFVVPVSLAALLIQAPVGSAEPRLAPVPESTWTDAQRAIVARFGPAGRATNALRIYLHHPVLADNILPFEQYISNESSLPLRHRELLILRTAWLCRSEYIWAQHAVSARKAGITSSELTHIALGPEAYAWDLFEAALLRAADELYVDSFVSDRTWSALSAKYDTHQAMDAVFTVAEFTMIAGAVNSLGVPVDDGHEDRLPSDIPYAVTAARTNERLIGKRARVAALEPTEWSPEVRQWLAPSDRGAPRGGGVVAL